MHAKNPARQIFAKALFHHLKFDVSITQTFWLRAVARTIAMNPPSDSCSKTTVYRILSIIPRQYSRARTRPSRFRLSLKSISTARRDESRRGTRECVRHVRLGHSEGARARPRIVLRIPYQPSLHWIGLDVHPNLLELARIPHAVIVGFFLPKRLAGSS